MAQENWQYPQHISKVRVTVQIGKYKGMGGIISHVKVGGPYVYVQMDNGISRDFHCKNLEVVT